MAMRSTGRNIDPKILRAAGAVSAIVPPRTACTAPSDVVDLVSAMRDDGLRNMPIVEGTRLVGIVTRCEHHAACPVPVVWLAYDWAGAFQRRCGVGLREG